MVEIDEETYEEVFILSIYVKIFLFKYDNRIGQGHI